MKHLPLLLLLGLPAQALYMHLPFIFPLLG
jgi:hypothetical protein